MEQCLEVIQYSTVHPCANIKMGACDAQVEETEGERVERFAPEEVGEVVDRRVGEDYASAGGEAMPYEDTRSRIIRLDPQGDSWRRRIEKLSGVVSNHPLLAACVHHPV